MATLVVELCRVVNQADKVIGYYPVIGLRDMVGPAITSYNSIMRRTQAQVLNDLERDLKNNFEPGDVIDFGGVQHATVDAAITAVRTAAPNWR